MRKRLTQEIFEQRVKELFNGKIKILGNYINAKTKIECHCEVCGHNWNPQAYHLLEKHGCPNCVKCIKLTHEEFIKRINLIHNKEIIVLEKFQTTQTKIKFQCLKDNHIWDATPNHVLQGRGCPKCSKRARRTHESFVEEIKEIHKDKFEILSEYKNARTVVEVKCNICDYTWEATPDHLINRKQGCMKCFYRNNTQENHPNWNPNLTQEERIKKRNYEDYVNWRNQVYERDNYTCQCCKQRGRELNAHHLDGYNWCKEKRIDVNNGITLCKKCHKKFHKKYGKKDNAKEQFEEFMKEMENI